MLRSDNTDAPPGLPVALWLLNNCHPRPVKAYEAYVDSLPTCGRATELAGSLQRLQHDAQALVLGRKQSRSLAHVSTAPWARRSRTCFLRLRRLSALSWATTSDGSSPRWSRPAPDRPAAMPVPHGARWRGPGVPSFAGDRGSSRRRHGYRRSRAVPDRRRIFARCSCACDTAAEPRRRTAATDQSYATANTAADVLCRGHDVWGGRVTVPFRHPQWGTGNGLPRALPAPRSSSARTIRHLSPSRSSRVRGTGTGSAPSGPFLCSFRGLGQREICSWLGVPIAQEQRRRIFCG